MSRTLLQKLQTPLNLQNAWKDLNKSNRLSRGLSQETVHSFAANLGENIKLIRKRFKAGAYQFSKLRAAVITKKNPEGELKKRGIRIAEIHDRVVQKGMVRIIEPILNKKYKLDNGVSFAYLDDKSLRDAIKRMILLYKDGNPVVFEADIQKFFDNVDREKLLADMIFPALPDQSLNSLIKESVEQELGNLETISSEDIKLFPDSGIPQGGGLSPLFANVYLNGFDRNFKKSRLGLVRYADDFIVMCKNTEDAQKAFKLSKEILEEGLKLKIHELKPDNSGKTKISKITQDEFEFLGVRFNGKRLWPSNGKIKNLKFRIHEITEFSDKKNILNVLNEVKDLLEGWVASYCFTDLEPLIPDIENYLRLRLGVCAYKMGWGSNKEILSEKQRSFSGIKDLKIILKKQRESLKGDNSSVFSEYWSKSAI